MKGADEAYAAGIVAVVVGAGLVFFVYPNKDEQALFAQYHREDAARRR